MTPHWTPCSLPSWSSPEGHVRRGSGRRVGPAPGRRQDRLAERERSRRTEGRFALHSVDRADDARRLRQRRRREDTGQAERPGIAEELDYKSLTLAQLRARLQSLNVAELEALLGYEEASRARRSKLCWPTGSPARTPSNPPDMTNPQGGNGEPVPRVRAGPSEWPGGSTGSAPCGSRAS